MLTTEAYPCIDMLYLIDVGIRLQGHRATNYDRWMREPSSYLVDYEEGYEPFVIGPRRLIPW